MDFTIEQYKNLLRAIKRENFSFQTFNNFLEKPKLRAIILRHDVDLLPQNSLRFAKIQKEFGIRGTYYFRAVPESWDEKIIIEIHNMGHEIGYHYENLTTCNGDFNLAIKDFNKNLKKLREIVPVKTICMHGSPKSKYDSKDLWADFNYKDFGIIGEPYFDMDFDKVLYLTDTGRRWDGSKVSVRDKVNTSFQQRFHSTNQIINALNKSEFPDQIMFTFHPQRWHDKFLQWIVEFVLQNFKNLIKRYLFVTKKT